jgi:ATP-dependent DNA ligase
MHVVAPTAVLLGAVPVIYQVVDVLQFDGALVLDEPYEHRRQLLAGLGLAGRRCGCHPISSMSTPPTSSPSPAPTGGKG